MPANPLSALEREDILIGIERGDSNAKIAARLGRHRATVGREIDRNGGRDTYSAAAAQDRVLRCRARPKTTILAGNPELCWHVTKRLLAGDSPMTISIELSRGLHGVTASISHETIYQGIYNPTESGMAKRCWKLLHNRRPRRRRRGQRHGQQRSSPLGEFNPISSRPPVAQERTEVGHLEGDLIIGARNRSAVIPIFDRTTRFLWLARHDDPDGRYNAETTKNAVIDVLEQIPAGLRRTLTWDRGSEMTEHHAIAEATGIDIYFCDAHAPWQRPTSENGNRLIRHWLPKGTDLSIYSQHDLDRIAHRINTIPRRSLGWHTAHDLYHQAVAMTA